jgi:hypothetical protein
MNRSAPVEARWMRACRLETVESGMASVDARVRAAWRGRRMRPAADVQRQLLHREDARRAQAVQRIAAADDDDRADPRRLANQPAPRDGRLMSFSSLDILWPRSMYTNRANAVCRRSRGRDVYGGGLTDVLTE